MEIGIDDFIDDFEQVSDPEIKDTLVDDSTYVDPEVDNDDFIPALLKQNGIEDMSKIKFENDEGETEEVSWDSLDTETKLNILNSSKQDNTNELDDAELQLINVIRQSQLSPSEYLQYVQREGINSYLQSNLSSYTFKVDELSDEELFVTDFMARTGVTEEEAFEALDRAKANDNLFKKLIGAMRTEYQKSEEEALKYNEFQKQQEAQEQFNQFAEGVKNGIMDFTDFAGYDLNMDNEDMNELYDFITGFDQAGNSYFGKALNDPPTLVKMAWFALYGEKMVEDISDYYKKEIANVRKESYNKGLLESKDRPSVVYKTPQGSNNTSIFDDIDNF